MKKAIIYILLFFVMFSSVLMEATTTYAEDYSDDVDTTSINNDSNSESSEEENEQTENYNDDFIEISGDEPTNDDGQDTNKDDGYEETFISDNDITDEEIVYDEKQLSGQNAKGPKEVILEGSCGDNAIFVIHDDGSMVIDGYGEMTNYSYNSQPWYSIKESIVSVEINGISTIGDYAFYGCDSLTEINIPYSVTFIGRGVFCSCRSLFHIFIPKSVTGFESWPFDWENKKSIYTDLPLDDPLWNVYNQHTSFNCFMVTKEEYNQMINDGLLILSTGSCGDDVIYKIFNDFSMVISGNGDMYDYDYYEDRPWEIFRGILTTLIIEEGVTHIGKYAFEGESSITSLSLGNSVESIGDGAFWNCISLESLIIPNSVTHIGFSSFASCNSLTTITIPSSVVYIGPAAFSGRGITSIIVSENNTVYDSRDNCNAIIEKSSNTLVRGCRNTIIPNSVTNLYSYAFSGAGLTSIVIPNSVTSIGDGAFSGCSSLTTINIPESITSIGDSAFYGCSSLMAIDIPDSVTRIGEYAFCDTNIDKIYVPMTVIEIDQDAFNNIKDIYTDAPSKMPLWNDYWYTWYGDNETVIHYNVSKKAYKELLNNSSLLEIGKCGDDLVYRIYDDYTMVIDGKGRMYDSDEDLFENNIKLPWQNYDITSVVINKGVTYIGAYAFQGCDNLTNVSIPNSVTEIGHGAFMDCKKLTSIIIPNSVTNLYSSAFSGAGLTSIVIPNSVTSIGDCAFFGCDDLKTVVIPDSIIYINYSAFSFAGMDTVFIPKTVSMIDEAAFSHVDDIYTDAPFDLWGEDWYWTDEWYGCESGTVHYNISREQYYELIGYQYGYIKDSDIELFEELERPKGLWISRLRYNGDSNQNILYTGKPITLSFDVYHGNKLLKEGLDYTVKYTNNTKVGLATITISGKGNYIGTLTKQFEIHPVTIDDNNTIVTLNKDAFVFNNKKQKSTVSSVEYNGVKLKNNTDYTVVYENADSSKNGTYGIHIMGKGNYKGELYKSYTISKNIKPLSSLSISGIKNTTYTGKEIEQSIVVKDGKNVLVNGEDYHVEYINNINSGTAYAIIVGNNYYAGSVTKTFKITPIALSNKNVTIKDLPTSVFYNHRTIEPKTSLTYNNIDLIEGKDYTVTYKNNDKAGKATITYKGIGNYSGTINASFTINKREIDHLDINMDDTYVFTKGGVKPNPTVRVAGYLRERYLLELNKDYTLSYKNNNEISHLGNQPTVTIKGKGNYSGTITRTFDIVSKNLSDVTITVPDRVNTGKVNNWKSVPVLTDNGVKLVSGKDYNNKFTTYVMDGVTYVVGNEHYNDFLYTYEGDTYAYDGSQKTKPLVYRRHGTIVKKTDIPLVGTTIRVHISPTITYKNIKTITGNAQKIAIRNYTGFISETYRIVATDISKANVSIPTQYYTGKPITPSKEDINVKIGNTVLNDDDYDIISYSNNTQKGTATVTIKGNGNYGGTKTVKFTIKQKSLGNTIHFDLNGGSGSLNDQLIYKSTALSNYSGKKVVNGVTYSFQGWSKQLNGDVDYENKQTFIYDPLLAGETITLYAVWK